MEELGKKIKQFIERDLNLDERVQLLDDLYWTDLNLLSQNCSEEIKEILKYLKSKPLDIKEIAQTLSLYNNLSGAYIEEFSDIIINFYEKDKIKFFKALNLNKDESMNLVYIFRTAKTFEDEDKEFEEVLVSNKLTDEEIDTARSFYYQYETICRTWI